MLYECNFSNSNSSFCLQDILTLLLRKGLDTEGVFRKAGNARALREIKAQLNNGLEVDLKEQSVILLAVIVKVRDKLVQ